jgi:hypothetical protein
MWRRRFDPCRRDVNRLGENRLLKRLVGEGRRWQWNGRRKGRKTENRR